MNYLEKIKDISVQAAKEAGEILLRHFKNVSKKEIHYKEVDGYKSPVTDWDLQANEIIKKHIHKNFPVHDILSEESEFEDNPSDWVWVVDPLDGTSNYINNKPLWGVSIGVFKDKTPKVAVLYAPVYNDLYSAIYSQGAFVNNQQLQVNNQNNLKQAKISIGHGHDQKSIDISIKIEELLKHLTCEIKTSGSAVIELIRVAQGEQSGTIMLGIKVWDVAAGVLLVREAGGRTTDLAGNDWTLKSKNLFASNSKIYKEVINLINNDN